MSGIVRKIDELGRIVIPKEIRKVLNIKNNDDLEINTDTNKITLSKYYRLESLENILKKYLLIAERIIISNLIVTDKEKIIFACENIREKYESKKISSTICSMINDRKIVNVTSKIKLKIINEELIECYYYFYPIIVDGDLIGAFVIYDNALVKEKDIAIIEFLSKLIKSKIN